MVRLVTLLSRPCQPQALFCRTGGPQHPPRVRARHGLLDQPSRVRRSLWIEPLESLSDAVGLISWLDHSGVIDMVTTSRHGSDRGGGGGGIDIVVLPWLQQQQQ